MITVVVYKDDIERALRKLKKAISGTLKEFRNRRYFKKPSEIKRERNKASRRKRKKV